MHHVWKVIFLNLKHTYWPWKWRKWWYGWKPGVVYQYGESQQMLFTQSLSLSITAHTEFINIKQNTPSVTPLYSSYTPKTPFTHNIDFIPFHHFRLLADHTTVHIADFKSWLNKSQLVRLLDIIISCDKHLLWVHDQYVIYRIIIKLP